MGNTGKPSKGCTLCVKRRVKCDQRKPTCSRCENIGHDCPGYMNEDDWVFKSENDRARKKALRLPTRKSKAKEVSQSKEPALKSQKVSPKQTTVPSLRIKSGPLDANSTRMKPPPLSRSNSPDSDSSEGTDHDTILPGLVADLEIRSVCLFMETFTLNSGLDADTPAYLDFLPDLYVSSTPDCCLREAVSAVAQANFLNRYGAHRLTKYSAQSYGKALALTNQALANPALALSDDTIASVFMLGLYELVSYAHKPTLDETNAWSSHVAGTNELLRMRGPKQLSTSRGRQLFRLVHAPILIKAMMIGQDPPQESVDLVQAIQRNQPQEPNGATLVAKYFQRATAIRAKILRLIKRRTQGLDHREFNHMMEQLIHQGLEVDSSLDLKEWATDRHWQPKHNFESMLYSTSTCSTDWYYFSSIWVLGHWARYWTVRICLYKSLLDAVSAMKAESCTSVSSSGTVDEETFRYVLQSSADEIIGCIGYAFGEMNSEGVLQPSTATSHFGSSVGALHIFWSLGVVVYSPYTTPEQRALARDAMKKVGMERGIAQAMYYLN